MALEELLASLEAEAADEAARLEVATQQEADQIVEGARAEARALRERASGDGEDEAREEAERRRAAARLEAVAALRELREEAFQQFLAELGAHLAGLRERSTYPALLGALVRESVAALPAASILRVDARDEAAARALVDELGAGLELDAALTTAAGVELASGDGRTVRNTVEERLANAEPELRVLFGRLLADPGSDADPRGGP